MPYILSAALIAIFVAVILLMQYPHSDRLDTPQKQVEINPERTAPPAPITLSEPVRTFTPKITDRGLLPVYEAECMKCQGEVADFTDKAANALMLGAWLDTGDPDYYRAATGDEPPAKGTLPIPTAEQMARSRRIAPR